MKSGAKERPRARSRGVLGVALVLVLAAGPATAQGDDPWEPLRFLLGSWEGLGTGMGGDAAVEHTYEFVLQDRFLHTRTRSVGEPGPDGKAGELHEDWGIFSYDPDQGRIVLRQFLTEGFVNTYVLEDTDEKVLVFTTESTEGAGGMQARLTFEPTSDRGYRQVLELASPGKDFFTCRTMVMEKRDAE